MIRLYSMNMILINPPPNAILKLNNQSINHFSFGEANLTVQILFKNNHLLSKPLKSANKTNKT